MNTDSSKQQGLGLSVRGLRKSYNGIGALKDMDFEVNPGEISAIMKLLPCGLMPVAESAKVRMG
jgi:ABC-type phosphonate transport system ATPase subunit